MQDCRRTLTVSLGNRLWGDVPSTCRKILENVLIDILTVLRPESAHKIRYKDLHLLVGDFSGYAFPATMGQARLVQVLGNIAAHASRGKFLWTEDRAARLLDITAVLVYLIRLLYPENPPKPVRGNFDIRPDASIAQITNDIALDPGIYGAYIKAMRADLDKVEAVTRSNLVIDAMRRDIGVVNTLVFGHWLTTLAKFDRCAFRHIVIPEAEQIATAILNDDGVRDVLIYLRCLEKAIKNQILSEKEYDEVLVPLFRSEDRLVLKAATSNWTTIQRFANTLQHTPLRKHTAVARRLRWLLATSPAVLRELIEKKQYVKATFLLRDWGRDVQVRNLMLAKYKYKGGFVFAEVVQALALQLQNKEMPLARLTDLLGHFPIRLRLYFLQRVRTNALLELLEVSECMDVAEFATLWAHEARFRDGGSVFSYIENLLEKKIPSTDLKQLSRLAWRMQWSRDTSFKLQTLKLIASKKITSADSESAVASVRLAWNVFQVNPALRTEAAEQLRNLLNLSLQNDAQLETSIELLQAVGCLKAMGVATDPSILHDRLNQSQLLTYFSAPDWDKWMVFLTAYGLTTLEPDVTGEDWFPRDKLIAKIDETEPQTEVSRHFLDDLKSAICRSKRRTDCF